MESSDWLRRRRELSAAAQLAIHETNPRFRLKGSFAQGSFHLLRDGSGTFSDVDLVLPNDGRNRHAWEADVTKRMTRRGWPIRVSVQHVDTVGSVGSSDSQLLALAELVRFNTRRAEPYFDSYILAKTCLTLLRGSAAGQAGQWASSLVRSAELARRGLVTTFDGGCAIRVIRDLPRTPILDHFRELVLDRDAEGVCSWTVERLTHSTVHPWLRDRMTQILRGTVA